MKRKIRLEQISIKSFVTELQNMELIKGGIALSDIDTSNTSGVSLRSQNDCCKNDSQECYTDNNACLTDQAGCDMP